MRVRGGDTPGRWVSQIADVVSMRFVDIWRAVIIYIYIE
jgi:hypothetical protein